jgi:hypothetical protein
LRGRFRVIEREIQSYREGDSELSRGRFRVIEREIQSYREGDSEL